MLTLKRIQIFGVGLTVLLLLGGIFWFAFRPQASDTGGQESKTQPPLLFDPYLSANSPVWVPYFNYLNGFASSPSSNPFQTLLTIYSEAYDRGFDPNLWQIELTQLKARLVQIRAIVAGFGRVGAVETLNTDMQGLLIFIDAHLSQPPTPSPTPSPSNRLAIQFGPIKEGIAQATKMTSDRFTLKRIRIINTTNNKSYDITQDTTIDFPAGIYLFQLFYTTRGFCWQFESYPLDNRNGNVYVEGGLSFLLTNFHLLDRLDEDKNPTRIGDIESTSECRPEQKINHDS